MARFQAQTTPQLENILDYLGERLGLPTSKKAELLREIATLSYWMVYQAEHGYCIQAQKGEKIQRLDHPLLHQLMGLWEEKDEHSNITLSTEEVQQLTDVLENDLKPTPALQGILERLTQKKRHPPKLQWNESE